MTPFDVKFVPTTFMVTALEPALIVCGRTALMLGAPSGSTNAPPHPKKKRQAVIPILAPIAFKMLKTLL
jgi:hypothetical protein